jgi:hypothetical protein
MLIEKDVLQLCKWLSARGASGTPHSGRTLLEHLKGTWALLHNAGIREATCLGGLFHSVYGTNAFLTATAKTHDREAVQRLIGVEAESLAWIFGNISRPTVLIHALSSNGNVVLSNQLKECFLDDINTHTIDDLQAIECANLLEQGELWRTPQLATLAKSLGILECTGFIK